MKIATFNVNGITSRLPRVLEWLAESQPDVACLQELKTSDATFPEAAFRDAGYGAVWHGQKGFNGVAVLAKGDAPAEQRRGLPGDPDDTHSRYLEARVRTPDGELTVASIYLPNGNPQPGPKFDYKLAWFERLIQHAQTLYARDEPVVLAGDYNVVPTNDRADIYSAKSWLNDALLQPQTPRCLQAPARAGLDRCDPPSASRGADVHVLGLLSQPLGAQRRAAHRSPAAQRVPRPRGWPRPASTARCAGAKNRAITRRRGWS